MANVKSSKSVQQSRVERGLNKIPSYGKEAKHIFKELRKELTLNSLTKRINSFMFNKDIRLAKKREIESIFTNKAKEIYNKYDGKICWGAIVRIVKNGEFDEFDNRFHKQSRNENHNFEVKIKRSEISKYEHIIGNELYEVKKEKKNKNQK